MAEALTARQTQILKTLIDEYIETAEPVGSEALDKKFNLGVSPATIRNEMVALTNGGYLRQPHTSSGRVPTPTAMKFYVGQLMEEKHMSLSDEVKTKEEVWDARRDVNDLIREATHALAERTNALAIGALDSGRIWHAGYANVFTNPEFADMAACSQLFSFLEEVNSLHRLFFETITGATPIEVLFGEELGWPGMTPIGIAATRFKVKGQEGALGIIGPERLRYQTIIPTLRYFRDLLEEIA